MTYRVIWDPDVFRALVKQFAAAGSPRSAVDAFDEIEEALCEDADLQGESRDIDDDRRILIVPPLGALWGQARTSPSLDSRRLANSKPKVVVR